MKRLLVLLGGVLLFGFMSQLPTKAQQYPDPKKQIVLVVPYPAGGPTDLFARLLAEGLGKELGQTVIIDNRAGAGGSNGSDYVAKAVPDGYTLVFGTNGTHAVNALIYPKLPYHPIKDFQPIALVCTTPNVLLVRKDLPVNSVADLIKLAKSQPGKLTYGSGGSGASNHLSGELLKALAKIDMLHVPYRGNAPSLVDLLGGRIDVMFDAISTAKPHIEKGSVRAIAVTTVKRSPALPNLPTVAEAGVPGYDASLWWGVWAPAKTPDEVVNKLNAAIQKVLKSADIQRRFAENGVTPGEGSAADLGKLSQHELDKWTKIVREAKLKFD